MTKAEVGSAQGHGDLGRAKSFISAESQQRGQLLEPRGNKQLHPVSLCSTENTTAVRSSGTGKACSTFKPLFFFEGVLQDGMRFIVFVSIFCALSSLFV